MPSNELSFMVLQIPPSRNHYVKITKRGGYKTAAAKCFEKEIWAEGAQARKKQNFPKLTKCRVEIGLYMYTRRLKRSRVDADNAPKLILDGLKNCGFYDDDSAVTQMEVKLEESFGLEFTQITVREI